MKNIVLTFFPFLMALGIGLLVIRLIFLRARSKPDGLLTFFFAVPLGLSVCAGLTGVTFLVANHYHRVWILAAPIIALFALYALYWRCRPAGIPDPSSPLARQELFHRWAGFCLIGGFLFPLILYARHYPFGGWDAWGVWNFKARFLYLSGENWRRLFDPVLWRTSPHYPLLLPLTVVWGWAGLNNLTPVIPITVALAYTLATQGVLFGFLYAWTRRFAVILAPLILLSHRLYLILTVSQYADIVLSFYFTAAVGSLVTGFKEKETAWFFLSGLFCACLCLTKPEGLVAAGLIVLLATGGIIKTFSVSSSLRPKPAFLALAAGSLPGALAWLMFHTTLSPGNQTFINGLISSERPTTLLRFQMILAGLGAKTGLLNPAASFKLFSLKGPWQGLFLWVVFWHGMGIKKIFRFPLILIPMAAFFYLGAVIGYMGINTYFEVIWWVDVSLNRILFSLLPLFLMTVFAALSPSRDLPTP